MNVFQRLHEEYLALNARVRTLETQVQALARELTGAIQEVARLRDQVEKSALLGALSAAPDRKPPARGGTRSAPGNPVGRPNTKARLVRQFLLDALDKEDHLIANALCAACLQEIECSEDTFWRAVLDLVTEGRMTRDGGKGTGRPTVLHRVPQTAAAPQNSGVS
jgi:hypothetical protein